MKKLSSLLLLLALSICWSYAQQAKYVFYFIGDGMGVNQVQGTEIYRAELEGKMGITPLLFTQFPYSTVAITNSATNRVTDSAAAGTALATGRKTKNSAIGVLKDQETPINSVAVWAKNKGCRVGIATSVTVNHATPGAFYAHAAKRTLITRSEKTYIRPASISMPVPTSGMQQTRTIPRLTTYIRWLAKTDIPSHAVIKII